ncbi:MAG: DUF3800 domain-containing protein [Blastocatellia bacterium]|nr:DUF3800 domain-containing protein [Blastocatellia bacterium]
MKKVDKSEWLISCDESGVHGTKYYGFGSLWMNYQRRGDFVGEFNRLREKYKYYSECKWTHADDRKAQRFMDDILDFFFKSRWLAFHCLVIRAGVVDTSYHEGSFDLARRKHFTMLLTNKMKRRMDMYQDREHVFRIWVDPIHSSYKKADEAVEVISKNILAQEFSNPTPEIKVITKFDSKSAPSIQLCDLLLGAVIEGFQQKVRNERKIRVQNLILSYLGWPDFKADTFKEERKFNIWYFHDPTSGEREIKSRKVVLKYPLPPIKK